MSMFKQIYRNIKYRILIIVAFLYLHIFKRNLINEEIWLISEKRTEARDNGYHLFKYLAKNIVEVVPVYVIDKNSSDYYKVRDLGKVIYYDSFMHFVYFLDARYRIGGQVQGGKPYIDVAKQSTLKSLRRKNQIHFFIKHGIAKDDIPGAYDYKIAGYDVMFNGSILEYNYYKNRYDYPDYNIKCPGLCRFDNLLVPHEVKKIILLMPTYRTWLRPVDSSKEATNGEKENFVQSEYYMKYKELLEDKELSRMLKTAGYELVFYPHYTMQPFIDLFRGENVSSVVTLAEREKYDVQELLMKSAVLITDYSSVYFDFGYMKKPVVLYQFDKEKYRYNQYSEGWFNYERDFFGPIFTEKDDLLEYVSELLKNNNEMPKMDLIYKKKINELFTYTDSENCCRVYKTIKQY